MATCTAGNPRACRDSPVRLPATRNGGSAGARAGIRIVGGTSGRNHGPGSSFPLIRKRRAFGSLCESPRVVVETFEGGRSIDPWLQRGSGNVIGNSFLCRLLSGSVIQTETPLDETGWIIRRNVLQAASQFTGKCTAIRRQPALDVSIGDPEKGQVPALFRNFVGLPPLDILPTIGVGVRQYDQELAFLVVHQIDQRFLDFPPERLSRAAAKRPRHQLRAGTPSSGQATDDGFIHATLHVAPDLHPSISRKCCSPSGKRSSRSFTLAASGCVIEVCPFRRSTTKTPSR